MWIRQLFLLSIFLLSMSALAIVAAPAVVSAQQLASQQLLEEIQSVPQGLIGEWTIGGKKFTSNEQTIVDQRTPAVPGSLAAILFVESGGKNIALQVLPLPFKASEMGDGPYVFWKDNNTAEVITFFDGKVERKTHKNISDTLEIKNLESAESSITLDPVAPIPSESTWEKPSRLLAISDLEGNYTHAMSFLENNGVIDDQGHWIWGDGHLVLIGDIVDRGQQVTELMWLIRRLEREASKAGGHVHYILGNHEAMVMSGDLRYIHPKYVFTTQRIGIPYDRLFGETSDVGRWWRSKNGVEVIGDLMFVHGGYSPLLNQANLDLETLNERIRDGLAPSIPSGESPGVNPVGHQHGPFWYRGYFDQHAAVWGKATPKEVQRILDRHRVKHIVIGHTLVPKVSALDESGRVIGIDVHWQDPQKGEGLLQEDGRLWRVTMSGERSEILLGDKR